ncbi:hypothetical protein VTJ04DRAFT_6270 [Mycothermus thermophilus]|uniref:uncharacterized protein n=1 Tax=Humicola insolens TaxID=85995 RepID=UPI003743A3A3
MHVHTMTRNEKFPCPRLREQFIVEQLAPSPLRSRGGSYPPAISRRPLFRACRWCRRSKKLLHLCPSSSSILVLSKPRGPGPESSSIFIS